MSSLKEKLGARIQEIRKAKKLTQEKLAEKINLDTPNLSNIERGKRFLSSETLEKIVAALGVSEKELFDFGHIKDRNELINEIINELYESSEKELNFYHRMIFLYKEFKK